MNWEAMTPEERDALVAEKVMNWQPTPCDEVELTIYDSGDACCPNCGAYEHIGSFEHGEPKPPRYTQSFDMAWKVVEKLKAYGVAVSPATKRDLTPLDVFLVRLWELTDKRGLEAILYYTPSMICEAALKAVGVEAE